MTIGIYECEQCGAIVILYDFGEPEFCSFCGCEMERSSMEKTSEEQ